MSLIRRNPLMTLAIAVVILGGIALVVIPLVAGRGTAYPLHAEDAIRSWTWEVDAQQAQSAQKEIEQLVRDGKQGDGYDQYVAIAAAHARKGDGKSAYQYLSQAIAIRPTSALAYGTMGDVMERTGALRTAHAAYQAALAAEPSNEFYRIALEQFLTRHPELK